MLLKQETRSLFAPITHDVALFAVTLLCLNAPQECFKKCKISRVKLFRLSSQVVIKSFGNWWQQRFVSLARRCEGRSKVHTHSIFDVRDECAAPLEMYFYLFSVGIETRSEFTFIDAGSRI